MPADLRTFLATLDKELLRVPKTVEVNQLSALINQAAQPVLFENLTDFPDWQMTDLLLSSRSHQAMALNVQPEDVLPALAARLSEPPHSCEIVSSAVCKDVILTGSDADLSALPAFQNGEEDMGPALMAMNVCHDPLSGNQNLSWTRMTPLSADTATYFIGSSPHMRAILAAHEERGENMPLAFVMGTHPAYEIMGSYSVLDHLCRFGELDMVGALLAEPAQLVRCETQALYVPANSEVVVEGFVYGDGRRVDEGPGPSQALYYEPGITKQPVFQVTAITHRHKPIMRQVNTLLYTDHQSLIGLPHEALLYNALRNLDIQVHDVLYTTWSGTLTCVVKVTPAYEGQIDEMLLHVLSQRFPNAKMAIAVDDDVDIEDPRDLHWSLATRVNPQTDINILPNMKGHPIDPTAKPVKGDPRRRLTGKMTINATKPALSSPEDRQRFRRSLPLNWDQVDLRDYL